MNGPYRISPVVNRRIAKALLAVVVFASPALAQDTRPWTWTDRDGKRRTEAELHWAIRAHYIWLGSSNEASDLRQALTGADIIHPRHQPPNLDEADPSGTKPAKADLRSADLRGANLSGLNLSGADLSSALLDDADISGTYLIRANLSGAHLVGVDLSSANLGFADLKRANLRNADLSVAGLYQADLTGADLSNAQLKSASLDSAGLKQAFLYRADLKDADLYRADLSGAYLIGANLKGARLNDAKLNDSHLKEAKLQHAQLNNTDLTGAELTTAKVADTILETKGLPIIREFATVQGLELLTYNASPDALAELRKGLKDGGFRDQERKVTYALKRREAELAGPVNYLFNRLFFDLTCQYGMSPGRPLQLVIALWLLCSVVYLLFFMHLSKRSGLYLMPSPEFGTDGKEHEIKPKKILWEPGYSPGLRGLGSRVLQELRLLRTAVFFSLMSAFNIGFRDINFGRWLRLLTTREYDIKAVGWARPVSGLQSLISVYFIALWVLTYFGRPFE
jgi:uncharacterized protein YjbI with pentapeptide repeats